MAPSSLPRFGIRNGRIIATNGAVLVYSFLPFPLPRAFAKGHRSLRPGSVTGRNRSTFPPRHPLPPPAGAHVAKCSLRITRARGTSRIRNRQFNPRDTPRASREVILFNPRRTSNVIPDVIPFPRSIYFRAPFPLPPAFFSLFSFLSLFFSLVVEKRAKA